MENVIYMKYSNIQVIDNDNNNKNKKIIWIIIMAFLMAGAGLMAYISTLGTYMVYTYYMIISAAVGMITGIVVYIFKDKLRWIRILTLLPMIFLIIPPGITGVINGARIWIDIIIYDWNTLHEDGIALLSVSGGQQDMLVFSLFLSMIIGELAFLFTSSCSIIKSIIYILFWIIIQLICGQINVLSCGILIAAGMIMNITGRTFYITLRSVILSIVILVSFSLVFLAGNKEIRSVKTMRDSINEEVEDIRYGTDSLPEGDIKKSDTLLSDTQDMLTVETEQEKNIYLKGYVGSTYDSEQSRWKTFTNAYYGGDNYGMLEWLYNNGFDPLNQTALYYGLTDANEKTPPNRLKINVKKASRKYAYVPSGTSTFLHGSMKKNKDANYICRGLFGTVDYDVMETSKSKPSELIIAEDWLENPHTDEQRKYIQAEAVYRDFVYNNYTEETLEYHNLMNSLFWDDYSTENDGIYEAVTRIRTVLKDRMAYSEYPELAPQDTEDALMWYISEKGEGNAVIYASIAVQALRAHGIPARYVEGYYVSMSDVKKNQGNVITLTGSNAHAWVEIYFDGVGWQPVDFTPGYYYEAAALQQLVNTPDSISKTAAFDNDKNYDTGKVVEDDGNAKHMSKEMLHKMFDTGAVILGIIAVIAIMAVCIFTVIEIVYNIIYAHQIKLYKKGTSSEKVRILEKRMYQLLAIKGIEATLGWHTDETDAIIADTVKNIEPGDYKRASAIMEKVIYGGCELEPYELRTLEIFADEIFADHEKEKGFIRYKAKHIAFGLFGNRRKDYT